MVNQYHYLSYNIDIHEYSTILYSYDEAFLIFLSSAR